MQNLPQNWAFNYLSLNPQILTSIWNHIKNSRLIIFFLMNEASSLTGWFNFFGSIASCLSFCRQICNWTFGLITFYFFHHFRTLYNTIQELGIRIIQTGVPLEWDFLNTAIMDFLANILDHATLLITIMLSCAWTTGCEQPAQRCLPWNA